jgi:hydroxypyruvate isomerase
MLRLAANLTMLFTEVPFLDRFASAAAAGFKGVEYLFPYDFDKYLIKQRLDQHGLTQVLHNLPAGDWAAGERGIGCHPDRHDEFEEGVTTALSYTATLGCTMLNCLAGIVPAGVAERTAHDAFIRNLRYAAPRLSAAGVRLLIEPINTRDIPGFFLNTTRQAIDIIDEVGSDNLYLQYDIYHMQIMEGDLAKTIERNLPRIAHMQLADPPGRHQPGTGEVGFPFLLDFIDRLGYTGWMGCEYKPLGRTEDSLVWTRRFLEPVSTER